MRARERCRQCPGTRVVGGDYGDGEPPCEVMVIGEAPGADEDRTGVPFIGQSGRELNENYLRLAGLSRDRVYVTNVVKCRPDQNKTPNESLVLSCGGCYLPDEVRECGPELIILCGGTACSLLPKLNLDVEHGIVQWVEDAGEWMIPIDYIGPVMPMYHPALGLHDTSRMHAMMEDWKNLKRYLEEGWQGEEDEYPKPFYQLETGAGVGRYLENLERFRDTYKLAAVDTEHLSGKPYSVQISVSPGTAMMVMADDDKGISELRQWLIKAQLEMGWQVILHNAPQDLDTLQRSDLIVLVDCVRDTMQEAFHLGLQQALKTLGYRLCGVRMQQYEDLVVPYSKSALLHWMEEAILYCKENLQVITTKQLKTKVKVIEKACQLERDLCRVYKHTAKGGEYKSWDKLGEAMLGYERVEDKLDTADLLLYFGPYPTPGLNHVPKELQVKYACTDADITLRVAIKLQGMRDKLADEGIMEGDCDDVHS